MKHLQKSINTIRKIVFYIDKKHGVYKLCSQFVNVVSCSIKMETLRNKIKAILK